VRWIGQRKRVIQPSSRIMTETDAGHDRHEITSVGA
jgi:hypothetical protein